MGIHNHICGARCCRFGCTDPEGGTRRRRNAGICGDDIPHGEREKFYAGGTYEKTRVYFGKDLKKTLDELWAEEEAGIEHVFDAEITEINGSVVTVRPAAGTAEAASSDKIQFVTGNLERIGFNVGTVVQVTYKGGIRETYPAQINAISWKNADDLRDRDFDGE